MKQYEHYRWLLFSLQPLPLERLELWLRESQEYLNELGIVVKQITECDARLQHYSSCNALMMTTEEPDHFRRALSELAQELQCDYCILGQDFYLDKVELAVFDMDSTLIPMEVIDELAKEAGVVSQVAAITEAAMLGELDFNQSFEKRLALLQGMPQDAVEKVLARLCFKPGVEDFLRWVISQGAEVAIASGGFDVFARALSEWIDFSEVRSNQLDFEQGRLTGQACYPIVNGTVKAESLLQWRQARQLKPQATIAVGDGANDLLMLQEAGFGIAYKAKPFLREGADCVLHFADMNALQDIILTVMSVTNKKRP
ncbi:phosphoserine phosphatase SerB [Kangiella shandongensis]|uniref:phosphoserine phosphatase SerB n=1 Tax=Kangiella shandongensis TaxID=2763258 RepID=UPI001CBDDE74|nr:phosphoserine phosphatase SerB [Kangiella shandongensis]